MLKRLRLRWAEIRLKHRYLAEIKKARDKPDNKAIRELEKRYRLEMRAIEDSTLVSLQKGLIRKARRLHIDVPREDFDKLVEEGEDENWYQSGASGELLLKNKAMTELRREVRREQKEKRDLFIPWLSLLVALFATVAAGLSVWLSQAQLNHSIESFRLDQRAWVGMKSMMFTTKEIKKGGELVAIIIIENTGRTPAREVTISKAHSFTYPTKQTLAKLPKVGPFAKIVIAPNGTYATKEIFSPNLPEADVKRLENDTPIYVFGKITYIDIFDRHHETDFCAFYKKESYPALNFCDTLNHME